MKLFSVRIFSKSYLAIKIKKKKLYTHEQTYLFRTVSTRTE